ncbi:hypothetical protein KAR91_13915 [Candidatus Pacearchaeota archaeon]|nr:hypothetical protein [Candidatus Pacearchaeota archaeon]
MIEKAARNLHDNSSGWFDGCDPHAPIEFWNGLHAALDGPDAPNPPPDKTTRIDAEITKDGDNANDES